MFVYEDLKTCLMFYGVALGKPLEWVTMMYIALPVNVRLGFKDFLERNTLAYYSKVLYHEPLKQLRKQINDVSLGLS